MSPLTTSKPESPTSPETGDAPDLPKAEAAPAPVKEKRKGGNVEVNLEVSRQRPMGWTVFGLIVGALLVWKLGTVGKWVGVVLLVVGAVAAYSFVRTLMFPAGTIVIGDDGAALPRGLCKGEPEKLALSDVSHAYLLRRAVPWTRAAPVLVVETAERAFTYPRDWFASEADQRMVLQGLHKRIATAGAKAA